MAGNLKNNPFAALFGSVSNAEEYLHANVSAVDEIHLCEKIFLLTTNEDSSLKFPCLLLQEVPPLEFNNIDMILFERLMIDTASVKIIGLQKYQKHDDNAIETAKRSKVFEYLADVYERCWLEKSSNSRVINAIQVAIINNLKTAIEQPEIFTEQDIFQQLQDFILYKAPSSPSLSFLFLDLVKSLNAENKLCKPILEQVLQEAAVKLNECSLMSIYWNMIDVLDLYCSSPILAPLLVNPLPAGSGYGVTIGQRYSQTVLGSLMSISCLPKRFGQKCEFFDKPSSQSAQTHRATEASIGTALKALQNRIHNILVSLLKISPSTKHLLLKWIEDCLDANMGRAGVWHIETDELHSMSFVSDGFMINLCAVLIQLSLPFVKDISDSHLKDHKVYKVDISYCSPLVKQKREEILGSYNGNLPTQTCLIPKSETDPGIEIELPTQFSFITSCFYHTHRAIHLGLQVIYQKMNKISQELSRLQNDLAEVSAQGSPATELMRKHLDSRMTMYLSFKATAFENDLVEGMLEFLAATCTWLIQVALKSRNEKATTIKPKVLSLSILRLEESSSDRHPFLQNIPEILVENIVSGITAVRRYNAEALTFSGEPLLQHFMSFIACFMGSPNWMNNPHLRANLAECLETLIPKENESIGMLATMQGRLFSEHPLAIHLVTAIIHVFVSIEMTGQSVAFEEKFNYRRPMYDVMKYLWDISDHKMEFVRLASVALDNMESAKTPLFLRFVNFLMNDAIFLLDEGLSYMSQIRENQSKKNGPEWEQLTSEQRAEIERNTRQMSMLSRFHNMLGSRTIQTLIRLTKEIPSMFVHNTLIDRMAAMLNHFLTHLVGPKQRNLKVKDMEKYEFRPAETVSDICTIYVNLSAYSNFAVAVASDGRSYSPELFQQACSVLSRISRHSLCSEIEAFSKIVKNASQTWHEEEDLASSAPDEFLDPIMSNLMLDPVLLPSSQVIVDRQTIARHLLSDQIDPFNRQPLTMDEVIPQEDLRVQIQQWLCEQRESRKNKDS